MSQYVPHPVTHVSLHSRRIMWLVTLLVLAVVAIGTLVFVIGDDDPVSSTAPVTQQQSIGGPNESARGNAAAGSAGSVSPETGGPNETARGNAAAGSDGSVPETGGPNEAARGQAAANGSR
jgi:hypothetical protein